MQQTMMQHHLWYCFHFLIFCCRNSAARKDILIGTTIAGRGHADLENIVGMFINTLVMRNFPAGGTRFSHFLEEVKKRTLNAFENQDYMYDDLVGALSP